MLNKRQKNKEAQVAENTMISKVNMRLIMLLLKVDAKKYGDQVAYVNGLYEDLKAKRIDEEQFGIKMSEVEL